MKYQVAAIQTNPTLYKVEENIKDLEKLVREAAKNDAKLIVLTEMATTGYMFKDRQDIAPYVEQIPGPTTNRFGKLAKELGVYIVLGMAEVEPKTNIYYNSAAFIGPNGKLIGKYRKVHSASTEPRWAKDGDIGIPVFKTKDIGNIGILICMDSHYAQASRLLALQGADVIALPTNWLGPAEIVKGEDKMDGITKRPMPSPLWQTRAAENKVYFVAADRVGVERGCTFAGGSVIYDPDGNVMAEMDTESVGIIYATVDLAKALDKKLNAGGDDPLKDRRPDHYMAVVQNQYIFRPDSFHNSFFGMLPRPQKFTAAVVQYEVVPGNKTENMKKIKELLETANKEAIEKQQGKIDIAILPELAVSGYQKDMARYAEAIPGPTTEQLIQLAAQYDTYIVAGLAEKDGSKLYNTAVLVDGKGVIGKYRKVHLNWRDETWATASDEKDFPLFDLSFGRIGILVGYDLMFPEATISISQWGADFVAAPAAWDYGKTFIWRQRAHRENIHLAVANDAAYGGESAIYSGEKSWKGASVRFDDKSEGIKIMNLDPSTLRTEKFYVEKHMPYWYDLIVDTTPEFKLIPEK